MIDQLSPTVQSFLLRPGESTDAELARFEQPARGTGGQAAAVALPRCVDELRELVREAYQHRIALLPQGANTGLVGGSVPTNEGDMVVVSLERLSSIEVFRHERLAVVGAGVRLSQLNAAAAIHGLHLPVDLSADPMLGGMIATNTGGSRVLRYGAMKNHVVSVQAVGADADASIIGDLDRVQKDSRGLDVAQLLIGSGGTLGVIVGAVIALSPMPTRVETWWLALDDPLRASELYSVLRSRRPTLLSAFEFVSANALSRTMSLDGAPGNPFGSVVPEGAVLAEWSSVTASDLDGLEDDIAEVAGLGLIADGVLSDPAAAWGIRHRVSESLRHYGLVLGHDVSVPLDQVMYARRDMIAAVGEVSPTSVVCDFGHVGDGGLHLNLLVSADEPSLADLRVQVRMCIDEIVKSRGGSYSAEHGLGPLNAQRWAAETPPMEQDLVRALKAVVDPRGILGHPEHPYNRL